MRAVIAGQPVPNVETMNQIVADNWHHLAADPAIRWNGVDRFYIQWRAREMVRALAEWGAFEYLTPLSVDAIEQSFTVPLGVPGWNMTGRWDLATATDTVLDLKTATEPWTQAVADKSLQVEAYYWGFEHLYKRRPKQFTFIVVSHDWRRTPEDMPEIATFTTTRSKKQVEWFKEIAREVARAIEAGVFVPNPTAPWCHVCHFRKPCMETRRDEKSPAPAAGTEGKR